MQDLLVDTLGGTDSLPTHTVLIVIDALDECKSDDAEEILLLLAESARKLPGFKFFVTSRPERHLRRTLRNDTNHKLFHLHEIELSVVEDDVRLYLKHKLSRDMIHETLPDLEPPPWEPSREELDALIHASGKLFIIATTAVLFILDDLENDPKSQLAQLLRGIAKDYSGQNRVNVLDNIYIQILRTAFPSSTPEYMLERFQRIIGAIMALEEPLPPRSLANLLGMSIDHVNGVLNRLHSIIGPSSVDGSPRIHHKSFPDFLTHGDRCTDPKYFVPPDKNNTLMAIHCLRIINRDLRKNMCNIVSPELFKDNDDLIIALKPRDVVKEMISLELGYACRYWGAHLNNADHNAELDGLLVTFVAEHLLHWLEALSWLGRLDSAYSTLQQARRFAVRYTFLSTNLIAHAPLSQSLSHQRIA